MFPFVLGHQPVVVVHVAKTQHMSGLVGERPLRGSLSHDEGRTVVRMGGAAVEQGHRGANEVRADVVLVRVVPVREQVVLLICRRPHLAFADIDVVEVGKVEVLVLASWTLMPTAS